MRRLFYKLIIPFYLLFLALPLMGQEHTILLFEQFVTAKIQFRNHSITKVLANYDSSGRRMLYKQGETMMELVGVEGIDTISFGPRKFIPYTVGFLEVVHLDKGNVFINWHQKDVNVGSRGAFGTVTQGTVKPLYMSNLGLNATEMYTPYQKQGANSTDVYKRKNDNEYLLFRDGKYVKFKSLKQLCKLFPQKSEEIKEYAKKEKLEMIYVEDVLRLLNFCMMK